MGAGKFILTGLAVFLGIKLFAKGTGLANFYDRMNYYIKARVHKINLSGITVHADIEIHNPTSTKLTLSKPTVRIYSIRQSEIEIGHSSPSAEKIDIVANGVTKLPTIEIVLPWNAEIGTLVAAVGKNAAALIAGGVQQLGINIRIKALFEVDGIKDITQTNDVTI